METEIKTPLPNSTTVLVLGICSIVFGCYIVGLFLGIIGLVLAKPGRALYAQNPEKYTLNGQLQAGFVCSIIGTVLGAISVIYWIIYISFISAFFSKVIENSQHV
jgi:hypothetical protein